MRAGARDSRPRTRRSGRRRDADLSRPEGPLTRRPECLNGLRQRAQRRSRGPGRSFATVRGIEAKRQRPSAAPRSEIRTRVPENEVAGLLDVRFSTAIRGYDRDEVDGYIMRVNEVLAELQITKTPETAVQRALEHVDREKQSVIEEAHGTAEEITSRSRSRADDRIQEATEEAQKVREAATEEAQKVREAATQEASEMREEAEREAREMRETVEQRIRELETHVEAMLEKRARVIEELRVLAGHIDEFVDGEAAERDPTPVPAQADGTG